MLHDPLLAELGRVEDQLTLLGAFAETLDEQAELERLERRRDEILMVVGEAACPLA